jgi:hypothetical protein
VFRKSGEERHKDPELRKRVREDYEKRKTLVRRLDRKL